MLIFVMLLQFYHYLLVELEVEQDLSLAFVGIGGAGDVSMDCFGLLFHDGTLIIQFAFGIISRSIIISISSMLILMMVYLHLYSSML